MPASHELRDPILARCFVSTLRVVDPAVFEAVLLAEGAYLDQALTGRIRQDSEAERERHYRTSQTASVNA